MNRDDTLQVVRALGIHPEGQNGEWVNARCPFAPFGYHKHNTDNSPSFGIKVGGHEPSAFSCQGCHQSGSLVFLIQRLGQLRGRIDHQLLHSARMTELGAGLTVDFRPFDRAYEEPEPVLQPLNEAIYEDLFPRAWDIDCTRAYLERRGIDEATSDRLGLLYRASYTRPNRNDGGTHEWYRHDVLFPVRDRDGALYGWSGRTTLDGLEPKIYDENLPKRHLILGEHDWTGGRPKLIVEGLFGYAHLRRIGADRLFDCGALMGSTMTDEKAAILKSWGDTTILLPDNDPAGDQCLFGPINRQTGEADNLQRGAIAKLYGSMVLLVPEWPEGKSDPDQLTIEEVAALVHTIPYFQEPPKRGR